VLRVDGAATTSIFYAAGIAFFALRIDPSETNKFLEPKALNSLLQKSMWNI
jgi:hypothetical protein